MEIGDLTINKLSGPTSFRYLFPREDAFLKKAKEEIFLPIIILLGDIHNSEKGRCDPCDEEKGCFLVESDTFLNTLNQIAERYPIDLYTEYYPGKQDNEHGGVLFNRLMAKTSGCYETSLRGTNKYRCHFPNVRWHYADTRFWKNKVESDASIVMRYLLDINKDLENRHIFPRTHSSLFQNFLIYIIRTIREGGSMKLLARRLSDLLNDTIVDNKKNSLVYKQIKNAMLNISIDNYCYFSLECHGVVSDEKVEKEIGNVELILGLYDYIFSMEPLGKNIECYKKLIQCIFELWLKFTACLLDIYFLGRMLKTPKRNINSYVTVAFFGNDHSKALANFLDLKLYEIKYSSDQSDRCSGIDENINFNKDLVEYSKWRIMYQNHTLIQVR